MAMRRRDGRLRELLDPNFREEFLAFCVAYRERGSHTFEERALSQRLDPYLVDEWRETVIDAGRLEGNFDPDARVRELDTEGIAAEVLFPDFGLPFELYSPLLAAQLGEPMRDEAHVVAGNDAYNRWLVDFTSDRRERFAMMASISFTDPERAVKDIRWAKANGFTGVMLRTSPRSSRSTPGTTTRSGMSARNSTSWSTATSRSPRSRPARSLRHRPHRTRYAWARCSWPRWSSSVGRSWTT